MKTKFFVLIPLIAISLFTYGQKKSSDKYRPGGIISLNKDTIAAQIKMESITNLQQKVNFIDAGGKKKSFKPNMIYGFYFKTEDGKMIFESRKDIRISAFVSRKGFFINRVSNDIFPLYYFVTTKIVNTGVESQTVQVPYYMIQKDYRWNYYTTENFEDCVKIFSESSSLVKDIQDKKYTFDDFPQIVERFCKSIKK